MGDFWKGNGCGEPFKGDSISGGVGFWELEFVAAVVLLGGVNVEAIYTIWGIFLSLLIGFMDDDFCARSGKRSLVEVKIYK